jgi:hypothetical protein
MYDLNYSWYVGKKIESIVLNEGESVITFTFEGGLKRRLGVEGDCCSQSWIEHLEMPNDVKGATILSVDEPEMPSWDNHKCVGEDYSLSDEENKAQGRCGHDVLAVYHTRFRTDRGDIVLEYRNDSNGYYGGSLCELP